MNSTKRYPKEVKERAVRLVLEQQNEHGSQWQAIVSVASKLGMTPETLRKWVKQSDIDQGKREGLTTEDKAYIKQLERENKELKRSCEILKAAATFFGAELDRQVKR